MTRPGGRVVVPFSIRDLALWAERIGRDVITTGPGGEICAERGRCGVWEQEYSLMGIEGLLPMPGEHNLRNAETAIALARWAGAGTEDAIEALKSFPGVSRRLERVGELGSMLALSDYAHHPDEMKAAIRAAREVSRGAVGVVFQPHLYSRTAAQATEMGRALSAADWSLVLPIYPARETPLPGVSSSLVVDSAVALGADCSSVMPEELHDRLRDRRAELVIFMGAGSVDSVCREMVGAGL
jgi:UDP-N-acetylmuramate--alanine ligase